MIIVGHRGARGLAPENTIASLNKGLEHQADVIEFDLRVTKDDVVILHHDPTLTDASGNKIKISQYAYSELKIHKPDLTTFNEVLDQIDRNANLYVEIKKNVPVKPIVKIIKTYLSNGWVNENFMLGSKSQKVLLELQTALPDIPKIVIEPWSGVRAGRRARQIGTKNIAMNQLWLWRGFISAVSGSGYKLFAYTLNDPVKARRWAKYGLYGVVTDYPDRFEK